jgi:hypothetical protein
LEKAGGRHDGDTEQLDIRKNKRKMKVELYTKDPQGKCEPVGASYIRGFPMVGATLNSDRGIKWQIVEYAMEYNRHNQF